MTEMDQQYSDASRQRLEEATQRLTDALHEYVGTVATMHGGSAEHRTKFRLSEEVEAAVRAWNDAAFNHTGSSPLLLHDFDDEDDDWDEGREEGAEQSPPSMWVSVVSRLDVLVEDHETLLAAGRAAHQRLQPTETDEDAQVAVQDAAGALYAITHHAGEPWWNLPGASIAWGARAYIAPHEPPVEGSDDPYAIVEDVLPPEGELLFGESWR